MLLTISILGILMLAFDNVFGLIGFWLFVCVFVGCFVYMFVVACRIVLLCVSWIEVVG